MNACKRPSKEWLQAQIASGKTRTEIANACSSRNDTVTRWCIQYDIQGVGRWHKPENIECGKATVVAMIIEDGAPEKYAVPGGGVVDQHEARRIAAKINDLMGGHTWAGGITEVHKWSRALTSDETYRVFNGEIVK